MINLLREINKILISCGINIKLAVNSLPRLLDYLSELKRYRKLSKENEWPIKLYPIFFDKDKQAASLGEYFWQDLLVAKEIINLNPKKHIDVGSRVDGFIAHLACVRRVNVFDIRPLTVKIENVEFTQWDITNPNPDLRNIADCVSCLHTLEHIGLGRYGDRLDPDGWRKGLKSLANLLSSEGILWLSVPIGTQRVEFNAHRIFDPNTVILEASYLGMVLERFFYLTDLGFVESGSIKEDIMSLAKKDYSVGIYCFRRL